MTTKPKLSDMTGYEPEAVMVVDRKDYEALKTLNAELLTALDNIAANAKIIPDPAMEGTTDTYSVPLDDIETARAVLAKAYGR